MYGTYNLLCVGGDPKTVKGEKLGYITSILYLAPHKVSGIGNVCPHASAGCAAACLNLSGRGRTPRSQAARIRKTRLFLTDRLEFLRQLRFDISTLVSNATFNRMIPCVRLNGTSDIPWERFGVMEEFPSLQFYDYTKNPHRMMRYLDGLMPSNYHLTFSRSEDNDNHVMCFLANGGNVSAVFGKALPPEWRSYPVVKGNESDLRFLDGKNVVVGIPAKGNGKSDTSGFVIH